MQENAFFKWTARINSVLFLFLIILMIGLVIYVYITTRTMFAPNEVVVKQTSSSKTIDDSNEPLRLGKITKVYGNDVQYLRLNSTKQKRGYQENTRNIVFFEGEDLKSHWLFKTNNNKIEKVSQLLKPANNAEEIETVAIYYQVRNEDTDKNGKIDKKDVLKVALTSPNGLDYTEIDQGMTSIQDYSIDPDSLILTILTQFEDTLILKKYSLQTKQKISEREISRISKKF